MTTPFPFVAGAVLQASQLNAITTLPINDQTASYTLVVGDVGKRVIMNVASASTVTVNDSIFSEGDTIFIANKASDASVITAGAGVTINTSGSLSLAQYGGGTLVALSASTFTFFPAGGVTTLEVEFLLVGGGGGGGGNVGIGAGPTGGGGAGGFIEGTGIVGKDTYTVKVGAGGVGTDASFGQNGFQSSFINSASGGGGGFGIRGPTNGGSGGGGGSTGGTGISGEGNNGGTQNSSSGGGGGGASAVGGNAPNSTTGGAGGAGSSNAYNGSSTTYAGGGGGGGSGASTPGAGGAGGGGAGAQVGTATAGTANTGGGGGGGRTGGAGGSGKVIIRYLTADAAAFTITSTGATSGTPTVDGSYSYFEYNGSGTLVVA
jgi:hypothetical protein